MTTTVTAVRHLRFEDLGLLEPVLRDHGYAVQYVDAGIEPTAGPIADADLAVILGGPVGANDEHRYPFLGEEIGALRARAGGDRPTLGICLGAQLLARALGAEVAPTGATEIGYAPLELTPEGLDSPLRHLANISVLHWHNDRFAIPDQARRLARTPRCDNQAFALGPNLLGLQFHLETPFQDIERWLIGHAEALDAAGIDPEGIRHAASAAGPDLTAAAELTIDEWVAQLATSI